MKKLLILSLVIPLLSIACVSKAELEARKELRINTYNLIITIDKNTVSHCSQLETLDSENLLPPNDMTKYYITDLKSFMETKAASIGATHILYKKTTPLISEFMSPKDSDGKTQVVLDTFNCK